MIIWGKNNKQLDKGIKETERVRNILGNTEETLNDLDRQFCELTGLDKTDMTFLFLAIGLQMIRQAVVNPEFKKSCERVGDKEAAKQTKEKSFLSKMINSDDVEEIGRTHRLYNPSLKEIIKRPVPFDANLGAKGALAGGGRMGHRVTAIGYDPLLGLVFGTANIATSTLTTSDLISYHIKVNEKGQDCFNVRARTDLVLSKTADKLLNQGVKGKEIIAIALLKEIEHLQSDVHSKNSLPLPVISVIDSKKAAKLAGYGLDMCNMEIIGKQTEYCIMINTIIAMIHRLFYKESTGMNERLYKVKTKKILMYSNVVASSANLGYVLISKKFNKMDLGGLSVAIMQVISSKKYIKAVKEEFVFGKYRELIEQVSL